MDYVDLTKQASAQRAAGMPDLSKDGILKRNNAPCKQSLHRDVPADLRLPSPFRRSEQSAALCPGLPQLWQLKGALGFPAPEMLEAPPEIDANWFSFTSFFFRFSRNSLAFIDSVDFLG